jgi:hypothetical protein
MTTQDFQRTYERLSDDELSRILADKDDLVPEALAALEIEVQKRHVSLPEPQQWEPDTRTGKQVASLEDYDDYKRLRDQRRWTRWGYFIAIGPFVLGLALGLDKLGDSYIASAPLLSTLVWAFCFATYALVQNLRWTAYKCPQCSDRFGSGKECRTCGFPRSTQPSVKPLS